MSNFFFDLYCGNVNILSLIGKSRWIRRKEKMSRPLGAGFFYGFFVVYGYGAYNKTGDFNELTCGEHSVS
jgi:hypothetical protein